VGRGPATAPSELGASAPPRHRRSRRIGHHCRCLTIASPWPEPPDQAGRRAAPCSRRRSGGPVCPLPLVRPRAPTSISHLPATLLKTALGRACRRHQSLLYGRRKHPSSADKSRKTAPCPRPMEGADRACAEAQTWHSFCEKCPDVGASSAPSSRIVSSRIR
jgi:hypothetical protein